MLTKTKNWLNKHNIDFRDIEVASSDASFRHYYRIKDSMHSSIVMDSSEQRESLEPFMEITQRLRDVGVRVPKILAVDVSEGYLMMEDLGDRHLLDTLDIYNFESFYDRAIDIIVQMQNADTGSLPLYDAEFLHFEMGLMPEWYLQKHLGLELDNKQRVIVDRVLQSIVDEVVTQPQGVFVHRDFHSRNLMLTPRDEIVVIDYQDARVGAITYDLVSLLRDCYISFDREQIEALALSFRDKKGLSVDDATFIRWFDYMGLQRHIKVLGIFARLSIRDGKDGYLDDIPQTLDYILSIAQKYPQTKALVEIFDKLDIINKKGNE